MNTIIAEFGSKVRIDSDNQSDNDLLIISNKRNNSLISNLKFKGYSVTYYDYSKFNYLIKSGNLFCKHLEHESNILLGNKFYFKNIFENYYPNPNFEEEIKNLKIFYNALNYLKLFSPYNKYALNDINYVNVRNVLIKRFASSGEFIFSYSKLINRIASELKLSKKEIQYLKFLRILKSQYRKGAYIFDENVSSISNQILQEYLRIEIKPYLDSINFMNLSDYHLIRLTEMFDRDLSLKFQKIITSPNSYLELFRKNRQFNRETIIEAIASKLNKNIRLINK